MTHHPPHRPVRQLNPALAALTGSEHWSFVKAMPPDAIVIATDDGTRWIVQAHRSRGTQDENLPETDTGTDIFLP